MATQPIQARQGNGGDFAGVRRDLLEARHLPGYVYTSPEIYELEIEKIFMKDWLCMGRVEEYAKPGDYQTFRIASEPVLICRDQQGNLGAYANSCRHRGVEVAWGAGNRKNFKCPYHGWMYNLDGKLLSAPLNEGVKGFDFKNCRLPQLKLETWEGYIFINFDPQSVSLSEYLDYDGIHKAETLLQPGKTRVSEVYTFEVNCNWKFIPENLMDMYHVTAIHSTSFGKRFTTQEFGFRISRDGRGDAEYETLTMAPDGAILFGAMPWLKDKKSPYFGCYIVVPPTFNIFGRQDLIQPWITLPLDVDRTQITIITQFPEHVFELPGAKETMKVHEDFIRLVAGEDKGMLASLQNAAKSRSYKPGPMVEMEKQIHHALNYYVDRMFGEDAGRV